MTKPTLPEIKVPSPDEWPASVASWQHTGQSGQFQVNVDLVRGAGRAGAIPGITLSYQTGRTNGIFGLGWSLNIPAFHRGDGRSHPRYHDAGPEADKFTSTEYGELVTELSLRGENWVPEIFHIDGYNITRFRSRIESSFDRIEQRIDVNTGEMHWLTISRDCVTRVYGRTRDTRIADPEDPKRIAQWLLEEQWDSHGNYLRYEYKRENREGID